MTRSARSRSGSGSSRRRRRGAAKVLAFAALTVILAGVAGGLLWSWARRAGPAGELVKFDIAPGAELSFVASELETEGLLSEPRWFELYARVTRGPARPAPGRHLLRRGLSPAELLARITRSAARPIAKVTIVEGYNRFQVAERLEAREVTVREAFLAASADRGLLDSLGLDVESAEGYLFPATYELYVDSDASHVVRVLVQEALGRFRAVAERHPDQVEARQHELDWGLHELLTLASIVEKEAADASEHGAIASVFYNRLRDPSFRPKRMLQSDPTAGYGCLLARDALESCRGYDGSVTAPMLRDSTNSYNTYKRPGLPPGPIANPSESAFEAALNPPGTPFYFFVAGRSKRHVFSRTLSEHQRAISSELRDSGESTPTSLPPDALPRDRGSAALGR